MHSNRFFKVMMPGFRTRLNLPPSFCEQLSGERSKEAVVMSRKGSWRVKLCKNSIEGQFYLEDGWDEFVRQHDLHVGDFLLFEHMGDLSFQVVVFEFSTCCEKEFPAAENNNRLPSSDNKILKETAAYSLTSPSFTLRMQRTNVCARGAYMTIPIVFAKSHRLKARRKVLLRGPSRKLHEVKLRWQSYPHRLLTSLGWSQFCKSNNLKLDDLCHFKIVGTAEDNTLIFDVEINPQQN